MAACKQKYTATGVFDLIRAHGGGADQDQQHFGRVVADRDSEIRMYGRNPDPYT